MCLNHSYALPWAHLHGSLPGPFASHPSIGAPFDFASAHAWTHIHVVLLLLGMYLRGMHRGCPSTIALHGHDTWMSSRPSFGPHPVAPWLRPLRSQVCARHLRRSRLASGSERGPRRVPSDRRFPFGKGGAETKGLGGRSRDTYRRTWTTANVWLRARVAAVETDRDVAKRKRCAWETPCSRSVRQAPRMYDEGRAGARARTPAKRRNGEPCPSTKTSTWTNRSRT